MRLAILLVFLLVGCKQVPVLPSLTPYKIDIQQGNHVTQEMVEKLKPGMTRSQVKFLLGTPLVVDPFRNDRWDYVYLNYKAGELVEQRRVSVIFEQDKLKRVDGDVVAASPDSSKKDGTGAPPPASAPAKSTSAGDKPSDKPPAAGPGTAAATPAPKVEPAR